MDNDTAPDFDELGLRRAAPPEPRKIASPARKPEEISSPTWKPTYPGEQPPF